MLMQHFVGQHIHEDILVVTRPHWIVFASKIGTALLLLAAAPLFYTAAGYFVPFFLQEPYRLLFWMSTVLYAFFVWAFFFLSWLRYWLDVWIVTTERIIKIEQHNLFRREMSEFSLSRVQDVTIEISGIFATVAKFGNLTVLTASEGPGFIFRHIPHPEHVKDIILQYQKLASPPHA